MNPLLIEKQKNKLSKFNLQLDSQKEKKKCDIPRVSYSDRQISVNFQQIFFDTGYKRRIYNIESINEVPE